MKAVVVLGVLTAVTGASLALAGQKPGKRVVVDGHQIRYCARGMCAAGEGWARQSMRNYRRWRWAEEREQLLTVTVEKLHRRLTLRRLQARQPSPIPPDHGWRATDHEAAWLCIHRYEGDWDANTGNGYYGGLQLDLDFQRTYAPDLLAAKGTADNWTPAEQMMVAERAYDSGRGFWPWPNTARMCGLL